uniref:delta-like protein 4 isoform X1 n=1 Tax=Solea senegalensis TaxID=28829 RepID=UPI001CD90F3A|nr:delta-like protein 4 isoform X1 [Solea senegalensis]
MVVDDAQFINIFKGKRIKLTLKTSSYLGVVQRINPNKTLVLADVANASNGCKIPGSKLFFGHEILNVEFTSEANSDSGKDIDHHLEVEEFQPYLKTMTIGESNMYVTGLEIFGRCIQASHLRGLCFFADHDEGEEECIDFIVIDEFHEKFAPAVIHIKKQHVIGVGANGVEVFKHGRLCWLQIATKNKVYLFDVLLLGGRAFKNGLSSILESEGILKVMHDCRAIAGCLVAQFGVKLTNVFDTQVADVMCFHTETGGFLPDRVSTLQEVVSLHLKVPPSQLVSLQIQSQLTKEENEMWYVRPCPVALLKVMALSVIHLQPLRLVLLDTLMTDYMTLVDSYITNSHFDPEDLENVGKVLGSGVFELDLHHFQNTRGLLANGLRCSMSGCRTYFRVCLKNFQKVVSPGDCIFGEVATPVLGSDTFSIQQRDARLRLPLNGAWPGAFSLVIEAWYSPAADPPGDTTNPDFLISSFAIQRQLGIGLEWSQDVQSGTQTELRYSYRFICNDNYYGDTCSIKCTPRDDHFGHYTCSPDGQKACRPGWKGEYCQEPICLDGCNERHGNCTLPGECKCREGWQGLFCDVCKLHPSCKHGTCAEPWQCTCKEGWGGIFCDQDLNYCTHHKPCANGATCLNTGHGSYTCTCLPGFTGVNCDSEVRECDSQPCHNGGHCVDSENGYGCVCPPGFEGTRCENKVLTCADAPCFQRGKCIERNNGNSYICECPAGYTGLNCEKKVDKCTSLKCTNGGHCVVRGNLRLCSCRSGFTGLRCEINVDECARNPCANGSTCVDRMNDYTCTCPPGYTGRHCDRPTDLCASLRCLNGGTCVVGDKGRPTCVCPAHFTGPQCQSDEDDVPPANTPSPGEGWESSDKLSLVAIGMGAGLVAVLVLICMAAALFRHARKQRDEGRDSETMNNLSKVDFQKENLLSTMELKNTNKKIDMEADCPREKSNHKHINHYHRDYKTSTGYKDELSLLDKDENCEKTPGDKKHLSKKYSERPECRISTICSPRDSVYQSVVEKNECIIATEV